MRLTDYIVAAGAIINAAHTGSHEITKLGLAHLDELLELASKDAVEIEARLRQPDAEAIVKSEPALHAPADYSIILPPDHPPLHDAHIPADSNVVAFPAHMVKRWPLLTQQPEAHDALMAIAKSGEIGARDQDGGAA